MEKRKNREGEEYHALLHPELYMVPKKRPKGEKQQKQAPVLDVPDVKKAELPPPPQEKLQSTTAATH